MDKPTKKVPQGQTLKRITLRPPEHIYLGLKELSEEYHVSVSYLLTSLAARELKIAGYELPEFDKSLS